MLNGYAGLVYVPLPAGGTVAAVTRYNPDGTTTDLTAVATEPVATVCKIDCALHAFSQTGQCLILVEAAASVYLGSVVIDVLPANVPSSVVQVLGTTVTEGGAGRLAGAFTKLLDVATPTGTVNSLPDAVPGAANGLLISGANTGRTTLGALTVGGANDDASVKIVATTFAGVALASTANAGITVSGATGGVSITSSAGRGMTISAGGSGNDGVSIASGSGNSNGILTAGNGTGYGISGTLSGVTAAPTANANADALLDRAAGVEATMTPRQALRLMLSALSGKLSISGATVSIRNVGDTVTRITATTTSSGERTAVTTDVS